MKVVILAGGFGTRMAEESDSRPKPMVDIGGKPLLWHIMKTYSHHGLKDFVICLGYKSYMVKEFFFNYYRHTSDLQINLSSGDYKVLNSESEDWTVTLVDTGLETMTGGRIKRVAQYLDDETFCLTYGDGLSNIDITKEIEFHKKHGKLATIAAVQPPGRFGVLNSNDNNLVTSFEEKPSDEIGWINGGFFVLNKKAIDYIDGDATFWEREPLRNLAKNGELVSYPHKGFWQPCDTLRDKRELEKLWESKNAPWAVWKK